MTFVVDIIAMVCGMPRALFPQMAEETFGGPPGGGLALGVLNAGLRDRRRCSAASPAAGCIGSTGRASRSSSRSASGACRWRCSALTSVLWLAVLYLAIGGWADLVSAVYRSTMLQVEATDEMRGRLQGVFTVVVAGGPRLADLVHGLVASATSTAVAVTGGGIADDRADRCSRRCWAARCGATTRGTGQDEGVPSPDRRSADDRPRPGSPSRLR